MSMTYVDTNALTCLPPQSIGLRAKPAPKVCIKDTTTDQGFEHLFSSIAASSTLR